MNVALQVLPQPSRHKQVGAEHGNQFAQCAISSPNISTPSYFGGQSNIIPKKNLQMIITGPFLETPTI